MGRECTNHRALIAVCAILILGTLTAVPVLSAPKTGGMVRMSLADSDATMRH